MSAFKPGDVAMVKNEYGVWNLCIRTLTASDGWVWRPGCADTFYRDEIVQGVRRLVVIDPEDVDAAYRLDELYRAAKKAGAFSWMQQALREFAEPHPVKPEEPRGLGAVVVDSDDRIWIHDPTTPTTHNWHSRGVGRAWHNVAAVRVLSDGWAQELDEPLAEWEQRLLDECCDRGPCALKRGHEGRCHG